MFVRRAKFVCAAVGLLSQTKPALFTEILIHVAVIVENLWLTGHDQSIKIMGYLKVTNGEFAFYQQLLRTASIRATTAQRAEAFLRAVSKWKD
jgi:hypothetical protein